MRSGRKRMHVVVCAYPALGHLNPLMRLSTLLAHQGIRVTFVSTHFFCDRLGNLGRAGQTIAATGSEQQQEFEEGEGPIQQERDEEEPGCINFEGLPDGLPAEFDRRSPSTELARAVEQLHSAFEDLMRRLLNSTSPVPSLIISDAFLSWTHDVAIALLIPRVLFWPQSAAVFAIFRRTNHILNSGINPFVDDLDADPARIIDFLPGLPALPASYLPYHIKPVAGKDRRFLLYENLAKQDAQCRGASCILVNSLDPLESFPDKVLRSNLAAPVKLVGPLIAPHYEGLQLSDFMNSAEFEEVMEWLNAKAVLSVLYICLGSVVSWTKLQVEEVGLGLMAKKQAFLWVMRPWEMRHVLPHEVLRLGKVVAFAPQIQVLGHPAIGGFLSHCGWNSTLESLCMGVPILAWPHFLDQFTNCWYVVHVWKIGVELGLVRRGGTDEVIVDRHQFAAAVTLLMEGENKDLMRLNSLNLRKLVHERLQHSSGNLGTLLSELVAERIAT